jgi:hypothetical protein
VDNQTLIQEARAYVQEARIREKLQCYGPGAGSEEPSESDDITMLCEDVDNLCDALEASEGERERLRAAMHSALEDLNSGSFDHPNIGPEVVAVIDILERGLEGEHGR